ncbi:MAG: hypothetical protein HQK89_11755 [Nitrospirae bacterium]|nr:hypothetical protein [Nitrospirota bacterium]
MKKLTLRSTMLVFAMLLFTIAIFTGNLSAQTEPAKDEPAKDEPTKCEKMGHSCERWEHMKKMRQEIRALRKTKMVEALGLDKRTSEKLSAISDKYDMKKHAIVHSMWTDIKELRDAVNDNNEDAMKSLVGKIEKKQKSLKDLRLKEIGEVKKILTVKQQAMYIIFNVDFRKEVMKMMHEKREKHADEKEMRREHQDSQEHMEQQAP